MSGYTRQQSYIGGDVILAEHTNDEFDLLAEVFDTTLGHKHDGTTAEGPTIDLLSDDDGDTKIQVEEVADDDTIRFDTAGIERLTIDSTSIDSGLAIRNVDGSSSVPVYSFVAATDTGMYRDTATGDLAFTAGGTKLFTIETAGGVRTTGDLFVERNSNQYIKIDQDDTVPTAGAITSFSATSNAKDLVLGATTNATNDIPSAGTAGISFRTLGTEKMRLAQDGVLTIDGNLVWHAGNDGAASGLDADLLDGLNSTQFIRSDIASTSTGNLTISQTVPTFTLEETDTTTAARLTVSGGKFFVQVGAAGAGQSSSSGDFLFSGWNAVDVNLFEVRHGGANRTIWHSGNDGAASGLDADLLDGQHGSYYAALSENETVTGLWNFTADTTLTDELFLVDNTAAGFTSLSKVKGLHLRSGGMNTSNKYTPALMFGSSDPDLGATSGPLTFIVGAAEQTFSDSTNAGMGLEFYVNPSSSGYSPTRALRLAHDGTAVFASSSITAAGNTVWHAGNDGAASGLDADLLDGVQGSDYARLSLSNSFTTGQTITSINPTLTLKDSDAGSPSVVAGSILFTDSSNAVAGTVGFPGGNNQLRIRAEDPLGVITFHSGGTSERARFEENGRFLLNTTLTVLFNRTTGSGAEFSGGTDEMVFTVNRSTTTSTGPCMITNKTDYVSGTVTHMQFRENGTVRGTITSNGSATAYNTTSDYRLKENVVNLGDATSRLKELQPKRFNFIGQDMTVDGFIAHEVQAVVPEAVTGEKDGEEFQQMDASKLVPLLTAALKETTEKLENVVGRLAELEVRIQELEGK